MIGSSLTIDGRLYTLVGIMSPGFAFPDAQTDFWIPLRQLRCCRHRNLDPTHPTAAYADGVFARLRDGVTIEAASAETDALLRTLVSSGRRKPVAIRSRPDFPRVSRGAPKSCR